MHVIPFLLTIFTLSLAQRPPPRPLSSPLPPLLLPLLLSSLRLSLLPLPPFVLLPQHPPTQACRPPPPPAAPRQVLRPNRICRARGREGGRGGRRVDPKEGSEAKGAKAGQGDGRGACERFGGAKSVGGVLPQLQARNGLRANLFSFLSVCASESNGLRKRESVRGINMYDK